MITGKYPSLRLRRTRKYNWSRKLVQENNLSSSDLIYPIFIIEGKNDDISAPGQCLAALEILQNVPDDFKFSYLHENAGHYGIFSGKAWREDIRPEFLNFINKF